MVNALSDGLAATGGGLSGVNGHVSTQKHDPHSPDVDGKPEDGSKSPNLPPPEVAAAIPCRFFPLGQCKYGDACAFSHVVNGGAVEPSPSPTSSSAAPESSQGGPSPQPVPSTTAQVDYAGYPMAPVAPPFYYYGMPQQFYPPMPYPSYVDANGYPIQMMGQPYVDYTSQQATGGLTVSTTQPSLTAAVSPGLTSPLADGSESPRLMEAHPSLAEHMAALSMAQAQAMSPAMSPFPMSPTLLSQSMAQLPPTAYAERRMSNSAYFGANGQPRPMRQSVSQVSRRSSTVGADPSQRTASAIISFPAPAQSPTSPMSPSSRSFGTHSRYSTEPGPRTSMNGSTREGKSTFPCAFFPENRCRNGDACRYTHELPSGQDARVLGKGMIGIDGRVAGPAEPSKNFVWPGGSSRGRGSGMRGGGRGSGLGRSFAGHRSSFGAYGFDESTNGVSQDGSEPPRRYVDDEARERVERFIESTRSSGVAGRPSRSPVSPMTNGMGQKVPSVGDFPALANEPTSPKLNGTNTNEHVPHMSENGDVSPASQQPLASKLASSFASAAARAVKATSSASTTPSVKTPASPVADTTSLPAVAVGASA